MTDVRTFPYGEAPKGGELDELRKEFVAYQFGFNAFSDHYTVVARFAWEKAREAYAKGLEDGAK